MKQIITLIAILFSVVAQINAEVMKINVIIGDKTFTATISETETGRAFYNMLPLTLNMNELNGNEKYCYLDTSLPTASYRPGTIKAGDLLLYGSTCVVLFYETFSSSYSYSRIGALDNPEGIAQAVGGGNMTVTFDKATSVATGIHGVDEDSRVTAIYDIKGNVMPDTDLAQLPQGIYIIRQHDGKTKKIIK
ncbi:MAG: hypothetical protein J6X70_01750 [Muribaculaceae bacterium]|nr:hypothetical protein [Muribaculaceae bacterium]